MFGFLVGAALAQPFIDSGENQEQEIPELWLQCKPVSGLLDMWDLLPETMRKNAGGFSQATPEKFTEFGGVLDGSLIAYGSQDLHLELEYTGTSEQVPDMLSLINEQGIVWQKDADSWLMELPDDQWLIQLSEGRLKMASVSAAPEDLQLPAVASLFPQEKGCITVISNGPSIQRLNNQSFNGGLFIPFGTDPIEVAFQPEKPIPLALYDSKGPFIDVKTKSTPSVVITLGFSPLSLLSEPMLQESVQITESDLRKIHRRLKIPAGSVMALGDLNVRQNPKVFLAVPIHNRFNRKQWTGLIWRGLKKALKDAEKDFIELDERVLSFQNNDLTLYLGVQKGRLLISTTRVGLDEMMANEGTPWIDEQMQQFSSQWPLAGKMSIPPMMGMMVGGLSAVELGVRAEGEHLLVAMDTQFSSGQNGAKALLQMLLNQMGAQQTEDPVEEYTIDMMKIAARQHQEFAENGSYVAVGRTGDFVRQEWSEMDKRVLGAELEQKGDLTEEEIADLERSYKIPDAPSAIELGWLSSSDESTVYWVELTEDSFLVHALVQNEPLDGTLQSPPIHVVKNHLGELERVN